MTAASLPARSWKGRHVVICNWRDGGHPAAGGAELYCEAIADEFHAAGVTVTYLTARGAGQDKGGPARFGRIVRSGGRFTVYPAALWWLWRNRRDIDGIIDSQNGIPFFTPIAARADTPIVQLIHHVHQDQFAIHFPEPVARLGRFLENHAARWVYSDRAVAAVSPSSRSQIRRRLSLRGPVHLTPCAQETPETVHRAPAARRPGRGSSASGGWSARSGSTCCYGPCPRSQRRSPASNCTWSAPVTRPPACRP